MIILEKTANWSFGFMWHAILFLLTGRNRFGLLSLPTFLSWRGRRDIGIRCILALLMVVALRIRILVRLWILFILFLLFFLKIVTIFECSFHAVTNLLTAALNLVGIVYLVLHHLVMITFSFNFCSLFILFFFLFAHSLP